MPKSLNQTCGDAGEHFVENLLHQEGWQTLAVQWRCRWGELDLVMTRDRMVAFIEVKTRSRGNWDHEGRLAVGIQKQHRLIRAAQAFLLAYPIWETADCRFDVALVRVNGQELALVDYLTAAFEVS